VRALVLGGTGFIGIAACRELMRRGVETIAASRTDHPFGTFTSHRMLDRTDGDALARLIEEVEPDVLLDLACYRPGEIQGVLDHFRGPRYVFVSTGGVYGSDFDGRAATEEDFAGLEGDPPVGELDYATGKRWCETLLMRRPDFPWVVVRPPAVIGAGDHTLRIAAYIQRVEDGGPMLVPEETYRQVFALAWSRDVGFGCALVSDPAQPAPSRIYNVGFEGATLERLIRALEAAIGAKTRLVPIPYDELPAGASPYGPIPGRPAGYAIDKARAELGFEPSALEDALAETLAWYRAARPSHPGYAGRQEEVAAAAAR
jgi:nucleoside-diphosphate-sugar epimerase